MRTILIVAAAAAALSFPGMALAQASGQADVPSSEHQNSAHANAPGNSDQPGYTTGGPRATPTSDTRTMRHRTRSTHSDNPSAGDMGAPNETNSSQPTDQNSLSEGKCLTIE
jgi:hypothetical protein